MPARPMCVPVCNLFHGRFTNINYLHIKPQMLTCQRVVGVNINSKFPNLHYCRLYLTTGGIYLDDIACSGPVSYTHLTLPTIPLV